MQVDWVCLSLCLMSVSWARWIFPEGSGPAPPSTIAYTGSSNSNGMKHSESIISLTSLFDPKHELDTGGFQKLQAEDRSDTNPAVRNLRYGFKLPTRTDTSVYGLQAPPFSSLNSLPASPPPPPPSHPQPLVLGASSYSSPYSDGYIGQPTNFDLQRVVRQYSPPLINSESFNPSVSYQSDEAFLPSTYFVQTEAPPLHYPSGQTKKKGTIPPYQYPTVTTTFKPITYRDNLSPKRHANPPHNTYKAPQTYNYVLSPKYDTPAPLRYGPPTPYEYNTPAPHKYDTPAPYKYDTPAPYKYNTPAPYRYDTPAPHKYNTPAPYKYDTPAPYKYNTPAPYKYDTPAPYKYNTPAPYKYDTPAPYKHNTPAPYKYDTPKPHRSYISSSYDVPKLDSPEPDYEHHKAKKYNYRYNVGSAYHGTAYRHEEKSDGGTVHGEYRVRLPDGRLQIVTYTADHENGYVPKVRYEGPQLIEAADIHFQPPTPTKVW